MNIRLNLSHCAAALATILVSVSALAQSQHANSGKIIFRAGEQALTASQYRQLATAMKDVVHTPSFAEDSKLLEDYARTKLLADRARKQGLDKDGVVAARLRIAADQLLARVEQEYMYTSAAVSAADINKRMASRPGDYDEISLSHILTAFGPNGTDANGKAQRTESEALEMAKKIKQKLVDGASFDTLAQTESDDSETAGHGGSVPPMLGMYVAPEFKAAVEKLKDHEISDPVRSDHGYHLIRLDSRKIVTTENGGKRVESALRVEAMEREMAKLLKEHPPMFDKAAFEKDVPPPIAKR